MSAHAFAIAEKLRAAGRLVEEASAVLVKGGILAGDAEIHAAMTDTANCVNVLWGHFGKQYLKWVKESGPSAPMNLGHVSYAVLQLRRENLERQAVDSDFVYRDVARLVLEIRGLLDGRTVSRGAAESAENAKEGA